jgi:hypothetical protein
VESIEGVELITIVGVPGSGASYLAGALYKLGADLGVGPEESPGATTFPAAFEYAPVANIDRDVLIALGGTWSTPPPFSPGWMEDQRITPIRDRAKHVSDRLPDRVVVNDPRLAFVQPLWETVGSAPATILCLRHPMAVAGSLQTEHGLNVDHGLFLWFRYSAAAILNRPDSLIVEHESLLNEPEGQLTRIAEHIALETSPRILATAASTVSTGEARPVGTALPESPIGAICLRLYDVLQSGHPLEDDEAVYLWARLATELPWSGPGDVDVRRARREVIEQGINVARLTRENQRNERRLERLALELQRTTRAMDEMALREIVGIMEALQDQGAK